MDERYFNNLLFEGISPEILADLDLPVEECRFADGEILFEEGDPGDCVYIVLEGEIQISKKGRRDEQEILGVVPAGGFFGEMALLDGQERSARATALQPTVVGRIDREGFERFLGYSPDTARHFAILISEQLRSANSSFIVKLLEAERLSMLGTMMSGIVHDIRNPLATLGQVSHYLNSRTGDPTLAKLGRFTEDAIDQMQSMIQELLDFARGTVRISVEPIEVPAFVDLLDREILGRLERSGITVHRDIRYDGGFAGDRQRLLRLFLNIVKNASEAMGGEGSLTLRIRMVDETVAVEIEDTGCGIEPEVLGRVFEPFVSHGKRHGTGLGMAIAKSVVDAHGGAIRMESTVGEGTTCHIELPVRPPVAAAAPVPVGA